MRAFKVINCKKSRQLERQFSQLRNSDCELIDFNYLARICVFDHFLDADEAHELLDNISQEERLRRDLLWSALYQKIAELFDIYMIKYRGEKLVFKAPRSTELLQKRLELMDSAGYVSFVIPELDIWYQQYWDDTHLVCYQDPNKTKTLVEIINSSGLYWLE